MEAFIYTRKSRALGDPDDDPDILAHQREALLLLTARQEIVVPPENRIEEVGSGEHLETRPRFAALLAAWKRSPPPAGAILFVVGIERISRAGPALAGRILEELKTAGVVIHTLSQRFDLSDHEQLTMCWMLMIFGHHGNNTYRQAVLLRKEQLLRQGELVTGRAPFGYRWNKNTDQPARGKPARGHLVVEPGEFAVVQQLFAEALTKSMRRLARETGLHEDTIRYILHNPMYTGYPARHTTSRRYASGKWGMRLLHPSEWVWAERAGNYPAAVTRAQFDMVQQVLKDRLRLRQKTAHSQGWCRDLLVLNGQRPVRVRLGSCCWYRRNVLTYCMLPEGGRQAHFPREPIHLAAEVVILAALRNPSALAAACREEQIRVSLAAPVGSEERSRLAAELARGRARLVSLKLEAADADPEDRLATAVAEGQIKGQIDALKRSLDQLREEPRPTPHEGLSSLLANLQANLHGEPGSYWQSSAETERRELANVILQRIDLSITPRHTTHHEREVAAVVYADWLQPFVAHFDAG